MSYVDQPERSSRSFSERFQDVWDHPTPFGLLAQIKGLMSLPQTVRDMVDASRIVTGPAPTTEEEAYIYNQARDYLPRAGFEVASAASPTVPKVVGGLPIRPTGGLAFRAEGGAQPANGVLPSDLRSARPEPYGPPPAVLRPAARESAGSRAGEGLTSSPAELPWWMQTLLPPGAMPVGPLPVGAVGRQVLPPTLPDANRTFGFSSTFSGKQLPEMQPSRPPLAPEASGGRRLPPSIVGLAGLPSGGDPNYRELRRVGPDPRAAILSRPDGEDEPRNEVESPPLAPEQASPERKRPEITASGTGGNRNGGRKNGNGGKRYCSTRREAEKNTCWQTWNERNAIGLDGRPWSDFRRGCLDRADYRYGLCLRNRNKDDKLGEWGTEDEERWLNGDR